MSFEKTDTITLNDHKYKYIREIRNIITEETAVLCEDECGSFCFCSKAEWAELIEKEKQAKIVQYEGSGQNKMIDPEAHTFNKYASPQEKIELFKSLFIGRRDVFARRFYNTKTGKSGYVPVCHNEWQYGGCELKCSSEENISFELPEKVSLIRTDRAYCRFTVIDDRIVWYGSLSPLCENFAGASAIRIINPSLAGRLMEERLL